MSNLGSRRRFFLYFILYVGIPSNGSNCTDAVGPCLPTLTLSPSTVYNGPPCIRSRKDRKWAISRRSLRVSGFGGGGSYFCTTFSSWDLFATLMTEKLRSCSSWTRKASQGQWLQPHKLADGLSASGSSIQATYRKESSWGGVDLELWVVRQVLEHTPTSPTPSSTTAPTTS